MGDVNGVGPEILAKAFAEIDLGGGRRFVVYGSSQDYVAARRWAPRAPDSVVVSNAAEAAKTVDVIPFIEAGAPIPERRPGQLDAQAGRCAILWLEAAVEAAQRYEVDAIVTCPLNKQGIHLAGYTIQGHTDHIAALTNAPNYRMGLFAGPMRIVHITAHLALSEALRRVERERIAKTIRLGHEALVRMGVPAQRIAVAGLNPHAGEGGAFGDEEAKEIAPAVAQCRIEGIDCSGPHSADTVFLRMKEGEFDLVVAMYHDQGHIPLKLTAMDEGVNITLGIPIVRTSVDHGTAYDIAGTGTARHASLLAALELASQLASSRKGIAR
jgi:4-hydroxythreonine-4-phosphate dehydrogenase